MPTELERAIYHAAPLANREPRTYTLAEARHALATFVVALREVMDTRRSVRIPGLGTFRITKRKARRVANPNYYMNGPDTVEGAAPIMAELTLPETHGVRFTPCKAWKETLR